MKRCGLVCALTLFGLLTALGGSGEAMTLAATYVGTPNGRLGFAAVERFGMTVDPAALRAGGGPAWWRLRFETAENYAAADTFANRDNSHRAIPVNRLCSPPEIVENMHCHEVEQDAPQRKTEGHTGNTHK